MKRRSRIGLMLWIVGALASGCAGTPSDSGEHEQKKGQRTVLLSSEFDDERAGEQGSEQLAAQMGLLDDPKLSAYVAEVGRRLVPHARARRFHYRFSIVDQSAPNAFALPGGFVYVSRGMLALAGSETELANVLGHEITHVAQRHASAQQQMARRSNPFLMPLVRMGRLAAYGRSQENDADNGGQRIAAAAGYDPAGMPTFLHRLGQVERLQVGSRLPGYLSTHPGSTERVAITADRARQIAWQPGRPIATDPHGYLERIEGLLIGPNPANGVFQGTRFLHPDLGFQLRFPQNWSTANGSRAVGATAPDGNATIFLTAEGPAEDPEQAALRFIDRVTQKYGAKILRSTPIVIGGIPSWRVAGKAKVERQRVTAQITFVPLNDTLFRITAVAPSSRAENFIARARTTASSFGPLPDEAREAIHVLRLRLAQARPGETLVGLTKRVQSAFRPRGMAVLNGVFVDHVFEGGEKIKFVHAEAYESKPGA